MEHTKCPDMTDSNPEYLTTILASSHMIHHRSLDRTMASHRGDSNATKHEVYLMHRLTCSVLESRRIDGSAIRCQGSNKAARQSHCHTKADDGLARWSLKVMRSLPDRLSG